MVKAPKESDGVFKSVITAYAILLLHVLLIAVLGVMVIFFRGIVSYMLWIFLGLTLLIGISAIYFYRRLKAQGRSLRDTLNSPVFNGRPVEISFLGGLASFRLGSETNAPLLDAGGYRDQKQLESPEAARVRELSELAHMLDTNLITLDEFEMLKKRIMNS
jgi:hypothetical protein